MRECVTVPGCCCCIPLLYNHLMDSCSYLRKNTLLAAKWGCMCTPLPPLNPPLINEAEALCLQASAGPSFIFITALHIRHDSHRDEPAIGWYGLTGRISSHAGLRSLGQC